MPLTYPITQLRDWAWGIGHWGIGYGAQEAEVQRGREAEGKELIQVFSAPLLPCSPTPPLLNP